jgi:hypothetical protein
MKLQDAAFAVDVADPHAARWYARARGRIAELDASAGDFAGAKSGAEGALSLLRAAAAQISETPELAADIADAELRLGALELDANQPASARRRFKEAISRYEALSVTEQEEPHWRAVLSTRGRRAEAMRAAPPMARAMLWIVRCKCGCGWRRVIRARLGLWPARGACAQLCAQPLATPTPRRNRCSKRARWRINCPRPIT